MRDRWAFLARLEAGAQGAWAENPGEIGRWGRLAVPTELKVQSQVVGRVPQGTILQAQREQGSWL
ncbi:MAG: hypothetical protein ACUVTW_14130 [Thermogutta sp.]